MAILNKESCIIALNVLSLDLLIQTHQVAIVTKKVINKSNLKAKAKAKVIITMAILNQKRTSTSSTLHIINHHKQKAKSKNKNQSIVILMISSVLNLLTDQEKTLATNKIKSNTKSRSRRKHISTKGINMIIHIRNQVLNQTRKEVNFISSTKITQIINSTKSLISMTLKSKSIRFNLMKKGGMQELKSLDSMILARIQTFIKAIEDILKMVLTLGMLSGQKLTWKCLQSKTQTKKRLSNLIISLRMLNIGLTIKLMNQ